MRLKVAEPSRPTSLASAVPESNMMPRESSMKDKTLSWVLFTLNPKQLEGADEQFRYLTEGVPKPSLIAREMYRTIGAGNIRIVTAPVTMIQLERISKLDVKVEGDKATGSFEFKVPELYEGKADLVANRKDGTWFIDEFMLPKLKVHILRDDKGVWSHKDGGAP